MIHARLTSDGVRFRLWSTITDAYYTDEMTEAEVREYLLEEAVRRAIEEHNRTIDKRIQRTRENGTSSMIGHTRDISGAWDA